MQVLLGALGVVVCGTLVAREGRRIARLTSHCAGIERLDAPQFAPVFPGDRPLNLLGEAIDGMIRRFQRDALAQRGRERKVRHREEQLAMAVAGTRDGLWDWDLKTGRLHVSRTWMAIVGEKAEDTVDEPDLWRERIHPSDRAGFDGELAKCAENGDAYFFSEHRIATPDDRLIWVLARGLVSRDPHGTPIRIVGTLTDITAQKEREDQLAREAMYDTLTGLANRFLFLDHLTMAVERAKRDDRYAFALLFFDLDRFKVINDGLGHLIGDKLLQGVADKIQRSVRATDTIGRCDRTIARLGGDEFVVLLDRVCDIRDAIRVAERMMEVLSKPFDLEGHEIFVSTSIGIAIGRGDTTPEELLRNADTALYRAKAQGRGCYAVFDMQMGTQAKKRLRMETDLRRAIEREEFEIVYQPVVEMHQGRVAAVEALIRWHHPELGDIPPDEFIPVAEETGLILEVGHWVLETSCRQVRAWQQRRPDLRDLVVNVNIAVKELYHHSFVDEVVATLEETGLAPRHLRLDVTESALMRNTDVVIERLRALRDHGIQLSIDDFGTGYSSLSYLTRFPMDNVKIDISFIREMERSQESLQLVQTILAMAQNLNLSVTSEGIENEAQFQHLRSLQCEYGQGFLFAHPLSAPDFEDLLQRKPRW
jgi:diguanylate cyclase (GGDEF)-like protein/PAS domain S-box-containing protein